MMKHSSWHILIAGLTVVAVLALDLLLKFLSKENLPVIATIVITMFIIAAVLNAVLFRMLSSPIHVLELKAAVNESKQVLSDIHGVLEKARAVLLDQERRLFSTWIETELIETRAKEVWVLTLDLYWDLNNTKYSELVRNKIIAGTRYWWLYPAHLTGDADDLKEKLHVTSAHSNTVFFTPITDNVAKLFPHDVVIYNPSDVKDRVVILCDVNGRKRDVPEESLDMPITDPNLSTRYRRIFIELAGKNTPPWFEG